MSNSPYPSQTQDKFVLRLPDGMRDRIKAAAEANNRSMNAEIVDVLEQHFRPIPSAEEVNAALELISELWRGEKVSEQTDEARRLEMLLAAKAIIQNFDQERRNRDLEARTEKMRRALQRLNELDYGPLKLFGIEFPNTSKKGKKD